MLTNLRSASLRRVVAMWGGLKWVARRAFGHAGFRKIVVEFFLEAGVLCFVFPVLDTIVQFGPHKVTWKLAGGSIAVAIVFLSLAGLFSPQDEENEEARR